MNKLDLLKNKVVFLVALTILSGCSTLISVPFIKDKWKETEHMKKFKAEKLKNKNKPGASKKPEKTVPQLALQKPEETIPPLPPLLQGGTKPLLIDQEDFSSNSKGTAPPCVDAKTGKAARFLLADLQSELIPLS